MPVPSDPHRDWLKAQVIGLTVACPYDQGNPAHCPLCALRGRPLDQRVNWVMALPEAELQRVWNQHRDCLARLESR